MKLTQNSALFSHSRSIKTNLLIILKGFGATPKHNLERYVSRKFKRNEILDFVKRDYPYYKCSLRSLARWLKTFGRSYGDTSVPVEKVARAVFKEINGPGDSLGYRAMQQKVWQVHGLNVPRQLVHDAMYQLDPEALENRMPGKRKKQVKGHFVSCCPDWVHSLDGHDKLMGYRNNIFPIAIYDCMTLQVERFYS